MRKSILHRTTLGVVGVLVVVAVTLGILRNTVIPQPARDSQIETQGAILFKDKGCAQCHATDSTKAKMGPGLKGLFDRKTLPASGRPVTEENVRQQLRDPYKNMPSFAERLTPDERAQIISYLKTL